MRFATIVDTEKDVENIEASDVDRLFDGKWGNQEEQDTPTKDKDDDNDSDSDTEVQEARAAQKKKTWSGVQQLFAIIIGDIFPRTIRNYDTLVKNVLALPTDEERVDEYTKQVGCWEFAYVRILLDLYLVKLLDLKKTGVTKWEVNGERRGRDGGSKTIEDKEDDYAIYIEQYAKQRDDTNETSKKRVRGWYEAAVSVLQKDAEERRAKKTNKQKENKKRGANGGTGDDVDGQLVGVEVSRKKMKKEKRIPQVNYEEYKAKQVAV